MDNYSKSLWVIEQLYNYGDMSFKTLALRWEEGSHYDGHPLSNATFRRRKEEIAERMNIYIDYNQRTRVYSITNADEISTNAVYQYLLGAFHISSLSSLAQKHRDRVQLQAPPTGVELLHTILEAIDDEKSLVFDYKSYYAPADKIYHYEVIPCFVRLFEGRWYVIVQYLDKSQVRVLALDRVSNMTIGNTKCKGDEQINADEYFMHCYGIIRDDKQPQHIRIRVENPQDLYVKSLPLHESQKIVEQGDGYTVFEYFVRPSFDFTQEILWNGDRMTVLSPVSYKLEVAQVAKNILSKYIKA